LEFGGWTALVEEFLAGELLGVFCTEALSFEDGSRWLHPLKATAKSRAVTAHTAFTSRLCNGVRFTNSRNTESDSIVILHSDARVGSIPRETPLSRFCIKGNPQKDWTQTPEIDKASD